MELEYELNSSSYHLSCVAERKIYFCRGEKINKEHTDKIATFDVCIEMA